MTSPLAPEFMDLQSALAGEYSLERELGRGGMGVVYLARDVQLDRHVAIKVLPPALASHADLREAFLREAQTAAALTHPNIVPVYGAGERGGSPGPPCRGGAGGPTGGPGGVRGGVAEP